MRRIRQHAFAIFRAALRAADPAEAVFRHVRVRDGVLTAGGARYPLKRFRRIQVVGGGKAGATMARAVERLLGSRIAGGLINVKYGHTARLRRVTLNECGHPVPDENGVRGAGRMAEIAADAGEDDLLICLISGGASALMPAPASPVTLAEKQATTRALLECGATIQEINCVRKHISTLKGGQLARLAQPATVLSLLLSDVIGDDPGVIGSGPCAPDGSTSAEAVGVVAKYGIAVPASVFRRLADGPETPKPGDPMFARVRNVVIGSTRLAVDAAARKARELGYRSLVLSASIEGETRDVARVHAAIAREVRSSGRPARAPCCLLSGGETTVTIRGSGKGGRNQEFALAAAVEIAGLRDVVVLSGGTDGTDGPTDAAGAIADGETLSRGPDALGYLAENDSYHYFEKLGDLLITGPTGTNVADVRIILVA